MVLIDSNLAANENAHTEKLLRTLLKWQTELKSPVCDHAEGIAGNPNAQIIRTCLANHTLEFSDLLIHTAQTRNGKQITFSILKNIVDTSNGEGLTSSSENVVDIIMGKSKTLVQMFLVHRAQGSELFRFALLGLRLSSSVYVALLSRLFLHLATQAQHKVTVMKEVVMKAIPTFSMSGQRRESDGAAFLELIIAATTVCPKLTRRKLSEF